MVKDSLLLQTIKLLSQRLAIIEPFFNQTACLHPEEREIVGYCQAYIEMFGDKDNFAKFLKTKAIPALQKIGISRWPRTELTDLGLRISNKDTEEVDISYLDPEVEEADIRK